MTVQACQTPNGNIWVGTGSGLFQFHPQKNQYEQIRLFEDDADVHILASDAEGHLWIGRWYNEHGVLEYDPVQRKVLREFNKTESSKGGFLSTELSRIYVDGNLVWFCCNEGGFVFGIKNRTHCGAMNRMTAPRGHWVLGRSCVLFATSLEISGQVQKVALT